MTRIVVPLALLVLAACSPAVSPRPVETAVGAVGQPTAAILAAPTPTPAEAAPIVPAVLPPVVRTGVFPLIPFGTHGAIGRVTVTAQGGGFSVAVTARNLAPGSVHSVHLHAGSCASAYLGRHLLVLGRMAATGAGAGGLSASLAFPYSTGRYVIIYANLAAVTIIGCADLGAIPQ